MLISLLKNMTLQHTRVPSVEPPLLETAHSERRVRTEDISRNVIGQI
jgi:hypothetical protein